jgi:deoxyribodipyrimidine photo-lyase
MPVDTVRILKLNDAPIRSDGEYVLYWMVAARRTRYNSALDRALEIAEEVGQPLLIFEPLRVGYEWASARFHRFLIEGMVDNARACADAGVAYYPYVEPEAGAGRGLLQRLAERASAVVTDDFPSFFLPRMVREAARSIPKAFEAVDGNGILPMRQASRAFPTAHQFRRFLHPELLEHLTHPPVPDPLGDAGGPIASPAKDILTTWPAADLDALSGPGGLNDLAIDHDVQPVDWLPGGPASADDRLQRFLDHRLDQYAELRNQPGADGTSSLSPFLHFGHIATHEVVERVLDREEWSPDRIEEGARGKRSGWWGISESGEGFLDELVTWRELGFNNAANDSRFDQYDGLPEWARRTLAEHADDRREHLYGQETLEAAETHDELWNAAQRQLAIEGRIHGYLRMLWGKKILQWSATPQDAFAVMVELNNKYALDGRDPNSYSGISWVLGRYDRPWGPERPIFGKVRYMTSENTARKFDVREYLEQYGSW